MTSYRVRLHEKESPWSRALLRLCGVRSIAIEIRRLRAGPFVRMLACYGRHPERQEASAGQSNRIRLLVRCDIRHKLDLA